MNYNQFGERPKGIILTFVMNSLKGLNNAQREAAIRTEGPLLIVAGAGAGKTKTLIHRILYIMEKGVKAEKILAVTFTNKAAREMSERVEAKNSSRTKPFISTFHSLCARILRDHGKNIGLSRHFTILNKEDSLSVMKRAMETAGISDKRFEPRKILSIISREKGNLVELEQYEKGIDRDFIGQKVSAAWRAYEKILIKEKSLDFDDLILAAVRLLRKNDLTLNELQDKWIYIHIDEYQDTNTAQYELSRLLAAKRRNICAVGDIDQSIYGWRGADYRNILNFERDFPDAKVIMLEENYRSTRTILQAANDIIRKNINRKEKNLFTKNKEGEKISFFSALNEGGEATAVAALAGELIKKKISPDQIAVLYRANFQSRVIEEAFLSAGLPYAVWGTRFFERKEVKDALAYIKLAANPNDFESLKRIINVPKRGLGKATLAKIAAGETDKMPPSAGNKVKSLFFFLNQIKEKIKELKPSEIIKFILLNSGWQKELLDGGEEGAERLENIRELASIAAKYDSFPPEEGIMELLTESALVNEEESLAEEKEGKEVRLMTAHASKGLEFSYVFIVGLEQDLFPHRRMGGEKSDQEEERRLFYVALTRAKEKIFLSYAQSRMIFGSRQMNMPSEFLLDISEELMTEEKGFTEYKEGMIKWD